MQNFLNVLGLPPGKDYNPEELKKAWKQKCNETHPDKEGGDQQQFLQVMHAYKMLTDPSYRREDAESKQGRKGDLNVRMQVPLSFEDVFFGKSFRINYNRIELDAAGQAVIKEEQDLVTIMANVPAGAAPGHIMVFPGHGLRCGDQYGDTLVQIMPQPHPRFRLEGMDVHTTEQIPLDALLKGGEVEVQTMYGLKTLKIPPGTRPGEKLEIKKAGVQPSGKHLVTVEPVYPSKEDLKKKEAWKSLDINWANHEEEQAQKDPNEELFEKLRRGNGIFINVGAINW